MRALLARWSLAWGLFAVDGGVAAQSFPYPAVPDTLETVPARMAYVLTHYWSRFPFASEAASHPSESTEEGLANFLDLIPRADSATAVAGIRHFVERLFPTGSAAASAVADSTRGYLLQLLDGYLQDAESPLHSDSLYLAFLRELERTPGADAFRRSVWRRQIDLLQRNSPGSVAADFTYTDRQGLRHKLHQRKGAWTLLCFYDPECDSCQAVMGQLERDSLLLRQQGIGVLVVCVGADRAAWQTHPLALPAGWIDGCSSMEEVAGERRYYLRTLPTLYLLDDRVRVVLKEPAPDALLRHVAQVLRTGSK